MTHDMWQVGVIEPTLKVSALYLLRFVSEGDWRYFHKEWIGDLISYSPGYSRFVKKLPFPIPNVQKSFLLMPGM